jgi:hypothetical protein
MNASTESQPNDLVRSLVGTAEGPNWSLKKRLCSASAIEACGSSSGLVGMWYTALRNALRLWRVWRSEFM